MHFGPWSAAWNRVRRWTAAGISARVLRILQRVADRAGRLDWATHSTQHMDGTVVRGHQHAAGAVGWLATEALGRKQSRRIATRSEKRAAQYLAILMLAAMRLWL